MSETAKGVGYRFTHTHRVADQIGSVMAFIHLAVFILLLSKNLLGTGKTKEPRGDQYFQQENYTFVVT